MSRLKLAGSVRHAEESDLFELAAVAPTVAGAEGRALTPDADEARRHLEDGCRYCERRLAQHRRLRSGLGELSRLAKQEAAARAATHDASNVVTPVFGAGRDLSATLRLASEAAALSTSILEAAANGDDALEAALADAKTRSSGPLAILYALQKGSPLAFREPRAGLALARAAQELAARMDGSNAIVSPARLRADAAFLESTSLLLLGRTADARERARECRRAFASENDEFGAALADYAEGAAATFQNEFRTAERLLKAAAAAFSRFGQANWVARTEGALGNVQAMSGQNERAIPYYQRSLEGMDPETDSNAVGSMWLNLAAAYSHSGRPAEARAAFARGLAHARRKHLSTTVHRIRNGLAELAFLEGDFATAANSFSKLAAQAEARGWAEDRLFAELYVAESLAHLGRVAEMESRILAIRKREWSPFGAAPAFEELFTCLDRGDLDSGVIRHVREFLEARAGGSAKPYQPLRQVG